MCRLRSCKDIRAEAYHLFVIGLSRYRCSALRAQCAVDEPSHAHLFGHTNRPKCAELSTHRPEVELELFHLPDSLCYDRQGRRGSLSLADHTSAGSGIALERITMTTTSCSW